MKRILLFVFVAVMTLNLSAVTIEIPAEAQGWNIPAEAIDVLQAREICAALDSGATTGTKYYVMGYVKKIHAKHESGVSDFGNAQFFMENVKGADSADDFMAYQVYGLNGQKITDPNVVAVGDFVVVYGELTNYKGTYETVGKGAAHIWNSTNPLIASSTPSTPSTPSIEDVVGDGSEVNPYTVEDVLALDNTSKGPHYVKGFIVGQVNGKALSSGLDTEAPFEGDDGKAYHTNIVIASAMGETANVVPVQLPSGDLRLAFNLVENPDKLGAEVLICGSLEKYFGVPGIKSPTSIVVLSQGTTPSNVVNIIGLQYADAWYNMNDEVAQYDFILYNNFDTAYVYPKLDLTVAATAKTAINGTYSLLSATYWASATESVEMGSVAGTVAVKNVKGIDYSFTGSFVGVDGKTYKFNKTVEVTAYDEDDEEIVLKEETTDNPGTETPAGAIVFDADVDKGNAGTDSNNAAEYVVTKNGVTMTVSSGILGTYNNEMHYRIYKNQTLTLTSTAGNIVKVEFTCTANDDAKYGPGCFTVVGGEYTYSGPVGTWTGNAPVITFTATSNQVRATQVVVTLEGSTGVENILASDVPEKVLMDGQIYIVRGENVYTILGAQVK
ncbi:MAG: hypothetical protein IIU55_02735 [Paludibacteraceae bacterium]|nr:hypothetical protein [Paludibacteraceae bacterium]